MAFQIRPVMSQHNSPEDTRGRKGNAQTSTQGQHHRAPLTFTPPLPAKGGTRTETTLRLCRGQGTGLAFPCNEFATLSSSLRPVLLPELQLPLPYFVFLPLDRDHFCMVRAALAVLPSLRLSVESRMLWFGDLQLLHFTSWIMLLMST